MMRRTFERYVALGDSTTEGLDDPDGAGGYRGWANRLAERIAAHQGSLDYANLGIRGRCARQIKEEQLGPALTLRPDLATVVAGMNDLLRSSFEARAVASDIEDMQRALVDRGCMVLTFTIPDISRRLAMGPFARMLSRRTLALNDELRRVSLVSGAILLDLAAYDLAVDPRMWSRDRLHANAEGHARTAAALAQVLGLPGTDDSWRARLPAPSPIGLRARVAEDLAWGRDYFVPWLWRRMRGRSAGDHRTAKLPSLTPIRAAPVGER
ncbi:MAG TPA: SGNH/GDSL hydrolase family protein [Kofleriaceae bacterium]|nr:SGNH/GDSL hydrolase family protein [Kofleriaceae bacterium]